MRRLPISSGCWLRREGREPEAKDVVPEGHHAAARPRWRDQQPRSIIFCKWGRRTMPSRRLSMASRVAPDDELLYMNLGRTYMKLGDRGKAREVMLRLLEREAR